MYEVGRAGGYVTRQMWQRRGRATLYAAAAALLAATAAGSFAGAVLSGTRPLQAVAAVAGLAAVMGCGFVWTRSSRFLRQARQAAVGARSERDVRTAVRRTGSVAAAYGLLLGGRGGDCDAVVFTRGCGAAAVEVKTGHGEVVAGEGKLRVGRRVLHGDPVRQAANQARLLSRRLNGGTVQAVVCVPGMSNRPFSTGAGVWVCSARDLKAVLDRAPRVFDSAAEAEATMRRLWDANPS
ncbi:NERD domain-containing protein [Actinomadura sp. KC345]|uniref:nuclease-related domain-containing protein n=1 Tax=Actinomadura sp. KC345 TaxID=2530371 RepID=UPI00104B7D4C|nr:nuclease-related domain-containing protein [Actinomadura sp. KC345]TDC44456.1 NERD domain-containing protein [Actinomadura sp. KC345]